MTDWHALIRSAECIRALLMSGILSLLAAAGVLLLAKLSDGADGGSDNMRSENVK